MSWAPRDGSPDTACAIVRLAEAREIVRALEQAWFRSDYDGPQYVPDVGLHTRRTSRVPEHDWRSAVHIEVEPILPDGQFTCNCG